MAIEPDARAWVEVSLDAVRANYDTVRRRAEGARVLPMVKADAYGVGAVRVARALEPLDPWGYGVATAREGAELREAGVTRPILVVTPLPPADVDVAAGARLTASISSVEGLTAWEAAAERVGEPLDFHVEVDTGMGRCGFDWRDVGSWSERLERTSERVRWTGVFMHFHSADAVDTRTAALQWERFQDTLVQLPVSRERLLVHAANSAAAVRWKEYAADMVRPGIFLYGGDPAPEVDASPSPEPVVSVRARVVLAREVPAGSTVGYGGTHVAAATERWGTLAIGYGDGLPRALGNRGEALVNGRRIGIIGRVSMDLTTVDLSELPGVEAGTVATLLGADGARQITLEEVAAHADTIGYEVLTRLGARLPRIERNA
ncbi:MAG TPA: alanine racemase [Longimicrobiales bacterium]|nr:alanine racemase [Longimicrobiales bacterium]